MNNGTNNFARPGSDHPDTGSARGLLPRHGCQAAETPAVQLETINRLYLELSQIATAKTGKELRLRAELQELLRKAAHVRGFIDNGDLKQAAQMAADVYENLKTIVARE